MSDSEDTDDGVPMRSETGKEILLHAMSKEYCVLEFNTMDDGTEHIVDITEHVEQLEEMAREAGHDV